MVTLYVFKLHIDINSRQDHICLYDLLAVLQDQLIKALKKLVKIMTKTVFIKFSRVPNVAIVSRP